MSNDNVIIKMETNVILRIRNIQLKSMGNIMRKEGLEHLTPKRKRKIE